MFDDETTEAIAAMADQLGVETAALLAVVEVESDGRIHARVNGRDEPLIRFEGHYFDRRLSPERRARARGAGLASPTAGAVANPASQAARWALLERAIRIDRRAAQESVSWGIGQVMGAHWEWLGYASVEALVEEARSGVCGQLALMARYIGASGLTAALQRRDWTAFARGYNGPAYAANGYHRRLAATYARHAGRAAAAPALTVLRHGMRGDAVRGLQMLLGRHGQTLAADGVFGTATQQALRAFQRSEGLAVDGIAGPATMAALRRPVASAAPAAWWRRLAGWLGLGRWT